MSIKLLIVLCAKSCVHSIFQIAWYSISHLQNQPFCSVSSCVILVGQPSWMQILKLQGCLPYGSLFWFRSPFSHEMLVSNCSVRVCWTEMVLWATGSGRSSSLYVITMSPHLGSVVIVLFITNLTYLCQLKIVLLKNICYFYINVWLMSRTTVSTEQWCKIAQHNITW